MEAVSFLKSRSEASGVSGYEAEVREIVRETFAQMSDIPAELAGQLDRTWQTLQRDLLKLSSHSTQIVAEKSGHYIHRDQPQVVIDAIRAMVDQVRNG